MSEQGISPVYRSAYRALQAVSDGLGAALVPEPTLNRLLAFTRGLPDLGQTQYLECRLGQAGGPSQIDLLVSAATTLERARLQALLAGLSRPELWPIARLVEAWASPASALYGSVPVTWLEFDHMEHELQPIANVGVCVAPAYLDPAATLPSQPAAEVIATVLEAVRVIRGEEVDASERTCFQRCIERLPPGARWIHLSVMAARAPIELKLYGAFPTETVVPYLKEVGWAGDPGAIARLLERTCPPERTGGMVYVDLPVTGMLEPGSAGLGIVFAQQQLSLARERDPSRRALLEQMVAEGLCAAAERDVLLGWPARAEVDGDRIDRWFDLKLAQTPGRPLLCKAYLGFAARALAPGPFKPAAPDSRRPAVSRVPVSVP